LRLAKEGAIIVIADIDLNAAQETARLIREDGGSAEALKVDLRSVKEIDALVNGVLEKHGAIFSEEKFDFLMDLNLKAYYFLSRAAARAMKTQENGGSIVCISSTNAERFTTRRSPYNISKAAVNGLVGTLAVEWGRFGIRINAVAPGYVMTDMVRKGIAEGIIDIETNMKMIPLKRLLSTEEIGNAVCFLASDEASGITGQTLFVDGGWSRCGLPEEKEIL